MVVLQSMASYIWWNTVYIYCRTSLNSRLINHNGFSTSPLGWGRSISNANNKIESLTLQPSHLSNWQFHPSSCPDKNLESTLFPHFLSQSTSNLSTNLADSLKINPESNHLLPVHYHHPDPSQPCFSPGLLQWPPNPLLSAPDSILSVAGRDLWLEKASWCPQLSAIPTSWLITPAIPFYQ